MATDLPGYLELWTQPVVQFDPRDGKCWFFKLDEVWTGFLGQTDRYGTLLDTVYGLHLVTDLPLFMTKGHVSGMRKRGL